MSDTATDTLRSFIERAERLMAERDAIAEDLRDLFAEAKAQGFDIKTLRAMIRRRELDPEQVRQADAMLETYEAAIGCGAFSGAQVDMVQGADGVHRPETELRLLELLTRGPEIWPEDADADHLVDVVERVEGLFDQRAAINSMVKMVLKMAEDIGLSPKGIRTIVAQRAMDPDKRKAMEGIVAAYRHVMGIEGPTGPVRLPPPVPAGALPAPKKLTAKEKQFREAMAVTIATQSFSTH